MQQDKPSRTAAKVGLNVILLGADPQRRQLLPAGAAEATEELLLRSGTASPRQIRLARSRLIAWLYRALDFLMPGQLEAFAHRKHFCEQQVRAAIASGAEQVLVLGAGYDTLSWRLAGENPGVRFFEIDHPATARVKARGIEAMGRPENLQLLPADLSQQGLRHHLTRCPAWQHEARSVIVAEGLIQYLDPEEAHALFSQCRQCCGQGSRLAFTHVLTAKDGRPDAGPFTTLILWLLKKNGEPWRSSMTDEERGEFLKRAGWRDEPLGDTPRRRGLECLALASRIK